MIKNAAFKISSLNVFLLLLFFNLSPVSAASANLSHSYSSNTPITNGSLVSIDPSQQNFVEPTNNSNSANLIGVSLAANDSLLAVDASSNMVQVALSGSVNTLVSTLNGSINAGDQIGVSALDGIGMKAAPGTRVIGVALTPFNKDTSGALAKTIKDTGNHLHQVYVGLVKLNIGIGTSVGTGVGGSEANFLQRLIKSITGHSIPTVRIILSLIIGFVAIISLITLIYASIYGSIVSVGRNPLARSAIFRTLTGVMLMAVITVAIACVSIFYLLH